MPKKAEDKPKFPLIKPGIVINEESKDAMMGDGPADMLDEELLLDDNNMSNKSTLEQIIYHFKQYKQSQLRKLKENLGKPEGEIIETKDPMFLELFRVDQVTAKPFQIKSEDEESKTLHDLGGAYNDALTSINLELMDTSEKRRIKCLKKCPNESTYLLNELAETEERKDREIFIFLGGLLAFAFLTGQCFGVELAKPVWKQLIGDKLSIEDVLEVDRQAYERLRSQYTNVEECEKEGRI